MDNNTVFAVSCALVFAAFVIAGKALLFHAATRKAGKKQ